MVPPGSIMNRLLKYRGYGFQRNKSYYLYLLSPSYNRNFIKSDSRCTSSVNTCSQDEKKPSLLPHIAPKTPAGIKNESDARVLRNKSAWYGHF